MTLGEIVSIVAFISERESKAKRLTVSQLNSILKVVDYDLIKEIYGQPGDPGGYETQGQISEALLPFKTGPTSIALTSGIGDLPADFYHFSDCNYVSGGDTIRVHLVTSKESSIRKENAITRPTVKHPIAELYKGHIHITPTTLSSVNLVYLKRPTPAVYVVKVENGIQVYDSGASTQPEWSEDRHIDIIRLILKYIGISMGNQQIIQYVEQKTAQEN